MTDESQEAVEIVRLVRLSVADNRRLTLTAGAAGLAVSLVTGATGAVLVWTMARGAAATGLPAWVPWAVATPVALLAVGSLAMDVLLLTAWRQWVALGRKLDGVVSRPEAAAVLAAMAAADDARPRSLWRRAGVARAALAAAHMAAAPVAPAGRPASAVPRDDQVVQFRLPGPGAGATRPPDPRAAMSQAVATTAPPPAARSATARPVGRSFGDRLADLFGVYLAPPPATDAERGAAIDQALAGSLGRVFDRLVADADELHRRAAGEGPS